MVNNKLLFVVLITLVGAFFGAVIGFWSTFVLIMSALILRAAYKQAKKAPEEVGNETVPA